MLRSNRRRYVLLRCGDPARLVDCLAASHVCRFLPCAPPRSPLRAWRTRPAGHLGRNLTLGSALFPGARSSMSAGSRPAPASASCASPHPFRPLPSAAEKPALLTLHDTTEGGVHHISIASATARALSAGTAILTSASYSETWKFMSAPRT